MFFLVVAVEFGAGLVEELTAHVTACEAQRNAAQATVQWQFTPEKARVKLAYPLALLAGALFSLFDVNASGVGSLQ